MNQWFQARPLREDEQASFQENGLSFLGEIHAANKRTERVVLFAGVASIVFGALCLGIATTVYVKVLSKPPQTFYNAVDTSTGYIGISVGAADAPTLFNEQTNQFWIKRYIELRENYTWETDLTHFDRVQIMSSDDERARFAAWHNRDPLAPPQKLGRHGYVGVSNVHADRVADGKAKTLEYTVRFDRVEVNGSSIGPNEHWTGDIQFQWHPEMVMSAQQRQDNPGGMVVISYHRDAP